MVVKLDGKEIPFSMIKKEHDFRTRLKISRISLLTEERAKLQVQVDYRLLPIEPAVKALLEIDKKINFYRVSLYRDKLIPEVAEILHNFTGLPIKETRKISRRNITLKNVARMITLNRVMEGNDIAIKMPFGVVCSIAESFSEQIKEGKKDLEFPIKCF